MEQHQDIEYSVVQTANPTGWRWTVYIPGRLKPKSGRAFDRQTAVRLAEIVIDRAIKVKLTKPPQH
jgi:hypothetical protein